MSDQSAHDRRSVFVRHVAHCPADGTYDLNVQDIPPEVAATTATATSLFLILAALTAYRALRSHHFVEMKVLVGVTLGAGLLLYGGDFVRTIALASPEFGDRALGPIGLEGWIAFRIFWPVSVTLLALAFEDLGKRLRRPDSREGELLFRELRAAFVWNSKR